jgi:hypothetical protein
VIALTVCAFTLASASKAIPSLFSSPRSKAAYTAVPLDKLNSDGTEPRPELSPDSLPQYNGRVRISALALVIAAFSARLEVYRRISQATECTISNVEVFLPLLLALYDCVRFQQYKSIELPEKPDHSVYDAIQERVRRYILRPRYRYMLSVCLTCLGSSLLLGLWRPLNSTYICPIVTGEQRSIPLLQVGGLLLDFIVAVVAHEMIPRPDGSGLSPRRTTVLWSTILLGTALTWGIAAVILYIFKPEWRFWLMLLDVPTFFSTIFSISAQAILLSIFCISTLHSVSQSTSGGA